MPIEDNKPSTVFDSPRKLPSGEAPPAEFEAAFVEIFGSPHEDLNRFAMMHALKLTRGNHAESQDLVQDAFLRILKKNSFDQPVNGRAYLTTILTRLQIERVRRRKTEKDKLGARTGYEIALNEDVRDRTAGDLADTVADTAFSTKIHDRLTTLVDSLPTEDLKAVLRAMLDLANGELLSCKDIEALTGFSNSKVKRLRASFGPLLKDALSDLAGQNDPRNLA